MFGILKRFRDSSISQKLTLIIVATSFIVLLIASVTFVAYSLISFRRQMVRDLSVQARIIGNNTAAAIAFNDSKKVTETLATLKAEPSIHLVYILDRAGEVVANTSDRIR